MREADCRDHPRSPRYPAITSRYDYSIHRDAKRRCCSIRISATSGTHHHPILDREDIREVAGNRGFLLGTRCQQWAVHGRVPGLYPTAELQYSAAGELAAAATGRLAIGNRRQWYRRAWPAQHDWSRLTLGDVEDDRPRRKTGGFPFAHDGSELRSQHSAMAACRGLTDGLLHSIAQAGQLQPGVWSTRLPTTSPRALAGHLEASGQRAPGRALARGGGGAAFIVSSSHHANSHAAWLEPRCSFSSPPHARTGTAYCLSRRAGASGRQLLVSITPQRQQ